MNLLRVGVLISGRGSNLQAILDAIASGDLAARVVVVVSNRADAAGIDRARQAGVAVVVADRAEFPHRLERQAHIAGTLEACGAQLVALAGFDEILGVPILERFAGRILNIHPSLLPAFGGGMHAVRDALAYGVKVSGCSVHFVTAEVDQGPIVLQAAVPVQDDDDDVSLAARILEHEHRLLPQAIQLFAEGRLAVDGRRVRILPAGCIPSANR